MKIFLEQSIMMTLTLMVMAAAIAGISLLTTLVIG